VLVFANIQFISIIIYVSKYKIKQKTCETDK